MKFPIFSKRVQKDTHSLLEENKILQTKISKLEEDREMLALIQDAENYAFFEYNFYTEKLIPSLELFKNLGYTDMEVPKALYELSRIIHPHDLKTIKANIYNQCIEQQSIYHFEGRIMSKSIRWIWIKGSVKVIEWETNQKPVRIRCIARIVDKKKKSHISLEKNSIKIKQELKEKDEHLNDLTRLLPEVVFETDEHGTLCFTNKKAYEIFGYTQSEFEKDISIFKCIAPEDRKQATKNFN